MLKFAVALLSAQCAFVANAQTPEAGPMTVVQKLFDAMQAHDAAAARALAVPNAMLFSVRQDGTADATPFSQFADHIGTGKGAWLERIWNPKVLEHDSIAAVWAEYDFHLDGKFSHCGIDSFSLLKTADGWKIVSVSDTRKKSGCAPSPLGPPKK